MAFFPSSSSSLPEISLPEISLPSSPTSSSSLEFPVLPVAALKSKIIQKIQENQVTLIIGETGCGKSSQVPQFLLEENMEPILCTQPRRFAVVAVTRMVAKARKCEVGGEVGYHIGHSRVYSERSKIVFKTAGVMLEEMLEKGLNALKYKVIILDEVHERSVESDLLLVCVKQYLLKKPDLRVVLMSATADIARYREYFRDLARGERVELLAIPSSGQDTIYQRKVSYIEQVAELLNMESEETALKCCSGPSPRAVAADIKPEMYQLILNLIVYIHKNEMDIEKGILVFLPTYYALEQQWRLLKRFYETFKVHILHRSIDTEQALNAMKICKSHRKVILATNIAESSVTIPMVGYVIDSCRSLQVFCLLVRLGLLKLVNAVSGLTQEGLPETLQLNFFRLRATQAKIQKIIVIATSILVQRQVLQSMQVVSSAADMDRIVQGSAKALSELLDSKNDAGIQEIISTLVKPLEHGDNGTDEMKLQQIKEIMVRMLSKSLQAGDAIFVHVARAIYLAGRGVVLGGTGRQGRELAEAALRQVGATVLIDEIADATSVLVMAAHVTVNVHGPWYAQLVDNM